MRSCYHGVYGMIRNNISKFAKQSFWKMWEEIVMGKRSLISLFTIFAVLILVVLLRFDDIKKLLNRLNEDRNIKPDRKSTRLNSSHVASSYAVFCLKKKDVVTVTDVVNGRGEFDMLLHHV